MLLLSFESQLVESTSDRKCVALSVYEGFEWQTFSIPLASASQYRTGNDVGAYPLYQDLMPSQRFSPKVDCSRLAA
eukprot:3880039-Rhodomonas_salina.1